VKTVANAQNELALIDESIKRLSELVPQFNGQYFAAGNFIPERKPAGQGKKLCVKQAGWVGQKLRRVNALRGETGQLQTLLRL
jgi:hypothetical protein